jgi:hypothetical protein
MVREWSFAGPYKEDGKDFLSLNDGVFPPETAPADQIAWKVFPCNEKGLLILHNKDFERENVTGYVRCIVNVPEAQPGLILVGSDDGAKVWFNGKLVSEQNVPRAFMGFTDRALVELKAGDNVLMVKVNQGGGEWNVAAKIRTADDHPVKGLTIRAK